MFRYNYLHIFNRQKSYVKLNNKAFYISTHSKFYHWLNKLDLVNQGSKIRTILSQPSISIELLTLHDIFFGIKCNKCELGK